MIYLERFFLIDGVSIIGDHADPLQYYFLPVAPKLTRRVDETAGKSVPQIQLIKYRGRAGNGGFLNFDVNLGAEQEALDRIRGKLRSLAGLDRDPRLVPLPLIDGTVRLLLLGRKPIEASAHPALYGNNQAAFSVPLDQPEVTLLEKALQGEMSPIGIVYSLDYLALRPAYSVRLKIDWERVQKHLDERFGAETIILSTEIDKAVDELREQKVILFEADTFVPEGEDESAVLGRRDQAVNQVRDMITDAFFKPSIDPEREAKDGWDKAAQVVDRASQLAVTGGWSSVGSFSYKKIDHTRIDQKSLNINLSERTTVKRSIYPQGHLSGLMRAIRDEGMDLKQFILSVDTDDPYYEHRKVTVISRASFEQDSIGSISVNLRYGDTPAGVLLESSTGRGTVEWASILTGDAMQREVHVQYRVNFKAVEGAERPLTLQSPGQKVLGDTFEVDPRELYSLVNVPVLALSFPWERYPQIEVRLQYVDERYQIRMDDTLWLDREHPSQTWKMFVQDQTRREFRYKVTYRAADHRDLELPWITTSQEHLTFRDPRPSKRTLTVVPVLDWGTVSRAFVDLSYADRVHGVFGEESFAFTQEKADPKTFQVGLEDPDHRQIGYRVTLIFKDGHMVQVPRSVTMEPRIYVRADMRGHRIVDVHPEAGDFARKKLREMRVALRFTDEDEGMRFADEFQFRSPKDHASFEYDYANEEKTDYEYQVMYLFTNGLSRTTEWTATHSEALALPLT
ncbi:MAG: hypothetical protein JXB05_02780 [Myxococcaceae bacterium]|nr:hypothetical protein [Myxococcaceae bacterium]